MNIYLKNLIFLFFTTFIFTSCNQDFATESPLDDFAGVKEVHLSGKKITLQSDSVLYDPRTLYVFDTLGICADNNGISGFSVVNLNTGAILKRFANTGGDSTKFNINTLTMNRESTSNGRFSILQSAPPYKVFTCNIDSLLKYKDYRPRLFYQFPNGFAFSNVLISNDSTIVGRMDFSKYDNKMLGLLNINTQKLYTSVSLPKVDNEKYNEYYNPENISWTKSVFNADIRFRPSGKEIAYFSEKGALIQILKLDDHGFKPKFQKLYYFPTFSIAHYENNITKSKIREDCKYGFNNITVTKDRIYALFNGKLADTDNPDDLTSSIVLVYDWNGKPIGKINLDSSCYKIEIDPNAPNIMYSLSSFKNIGLKKYNLPSF
jgi:hypothetical protein